MASAQHVTPDTLINLKVNHNGVTKKLKLPLRDLGASSLESKLLFALSIPSSASCLIERYSDSASAYVVLDTANVSVYKQLYRAAKAKQKLKLRVTTSDAEEAEESTPEPEAVPEPQTQFARQPKAVTIEDVPETAAAPIAIKPEFTEQPASLVSLPPGLPQSAPYVSSSAASLARHWEWKADPLNTQLDAQIKHMQDNHAELEKHISRLEASVSAYPRAKTTLPIRVLPAQKRACPDPVVGRVHPKPSISAIREPSFAVHCNSCDKILPEFHYHCQTCDDGDFDLCQNCLDLGITCYGTDHWLIKRFVNNGSIINSTTEKVAPKATLSPKESSPSPVCKSAAQEPSAFDFGHFADTEEYFRTCNNCVTELTEADFVHCTTCRDFDLCKTCFSKNEHGHNPKHGFIPAVEGGALSPDVSRKLAPGRNQKHNAICDGCDKYVTGVRHKCLDCPDWDYCSDCIVNAGFIHPDHRFVPIYEPLAEIRRTRPVMRQTHFGICCDGPLCNTARGGDSSYIIGERYKCTICHDLDFCANCEASPANTHNKTHPLLKFKTPVRHVSVTTTGEHGDGKRLPAMGDRLRPTSGCTRSLVPEVFSTQLQTVAFEPAEPAPAVKSEEKEVKTEEVQPEAVESKKEEEPEKEEAAPQPTAEDLVAVYERDTVRDGTVLPPNHVFEQTWVLRNAGTTSWPAGCSVKFVGGDYMGHVDPNRVAGIQELVSASESTISYEPLLPGQEFPFTVLLRTPSREGKVISYWRLQTKDGMKFGHRLWCDVEVQSPKVKQQIKSEDVEEQEVSVPAPAASERTTEQSQMIFPKLEKESPVASIHEDVKLVATSEEQVADDFEEDDEWAEDVSQDGFMTDDEYDILDASDEEYLDDQQKKLLKK